MRRLLRLFMAFAATFLVGCASAPYMPLAEDKATLDPTKTLYLMSVVVKNEYRTRWQPRVLNVILVKENSTPKPDFVVLRMDGKGTVTPETDDASTTYLVRFTADGAPHAIRGLNTMASAFPIHSFHFVPLHASVPTSEPGVYYLGAIKARIRERKDNEFRAGPVIPLIDQAIAGASTGTFDIDITDASATDIPLFKKTFTALTDAEVRNAVLAPWDRAKAQLFWEQN